MNKCLLAAAVALGLLITSVQVDARPPVLSTETVKRVETDVPLEWPEVAGSPVTPEVVGFIRAWVLEFCKLEAANPAAAAALRELHGFRADFDLFKCDNAFPGLGFSN